MLRRKINNLEKNKTRPAIPCVLKRSLPHGTFPASLSVDAEYYMALHGYLKAAIFRGLVRFYP